MVFQPLHRDQRIALKQIFQLRKQSLDWERVTIKGHNDILILIPFVDRPRKQQV